MGVFLKKKLSSILWVMGVFSICQEDLEAHDSWGRLYPWDDSHLNLSRWCVVVPIMEPINKADVLQWAFLYALRKALTSIHRGGVLWFRDLNTSDVLQEGGRTGDETLPISPLHISP